VVDIRRQMAVPEREITKTVTTLYPPQTWGSTLTRRNAYRASGTDLLKYVLERKQPAIQADGDYMCL
jgi:hypothetical protein